MNGTHPVYSSFYKLSGVPFQLTPDPTFFFASRTHENALSYLAYGLSQGEGIIALTGDEGTGRSTLLAHFLTTLNLDRYLPVTLVGSHLSPDTVLRNIASRLDVGAHDLSDDQQVTAIQGFLDTLQENGRRLLIVVDEADDLAADFFDNLQSVADYTVNGVSPVQLVLLGGPELKHRLNEDAAFEGIRQRVIASCSLAALADVEETEAYIHHRLRQVGWSGDPAITREAVETIHHFCDGNPRRINQLCSRLMLHGSLESLHDLDQAEVKNVIAELVVDKPVFPEGDKVVSPPLEEATAEAVTAPDSVAFDRRSVIETDIREEAEAPVPPTVTVTVERETGTEERAETNEVPVSQPAPVTEEQTPDAEPLRSKTDDLPSPAEVFEPRAAAPAADQQLIDLIVAELARLDPAIPNLAATALFGAEDAPDGPDVLASGGDASRLGLGPVTASMLYRAAVRELAALDQQMVKHALMRAPCPEAADGDDDKDIADAVTDRLDALEERIKTTEKLLGKAVKALKKRRK